jgi:hypothetical protein
MTNLHKSEDGWKRRQALLRRKDIRVTSRGYYLRTVQKKTARKGKGQ